MSNSKASVHFPELSMGQSTIFPLTRHKSQRKIFFKPLPQVKNVATPDFSSLSQNVRAYTKNYNNLMTKSYLERVYKVPQHIINNKEKIVLASKFEEPNMILSCFYHILLCYYHVFVFFIDLYQNLAAALYAENLHFLCDTISLIGDCFLLMSDYANAIHCFKELV